MNISDAPKKEQVLQSDSIPVGAENSNKPWRLTIEQIKEYVRQGLISKEEVFGMLAGIDEKVNTAEKSAVEAQQSASDAQKTLQELNENLQKLPDGQAVSAQVAQNTAGISQLALKLSDATEYNATDELQVVFIDGKTWSSSGLFTNKDDRQATGKVHNESNKHYVIDINVSIAINLAVNTWEGSSFSTRNIPLSSGNNSVSLDEYLNGVDDFAFGILKGASYCTVINSKLIIHYFDKTIKDKIKDIDDSLNSLDSKIDDVEKRLYITEKIDIPHTWENGTYTNSGIKNTSRTDRQMIDEINVVEGYTYQLTIKSSADILVSLAKWNKDGSYSSSSISVITPVEQVINLGIDDNTSKFALYGNMGRADVTINSIILAISEDEISEVVKKINDEVLDLSSSVTSVTQTANNAVIKPYQIASVNSVARIGYNPYTAGYPPQNSISGFKMAWDNGVGIMLADIRMTADGRFVMWHDSDLGLADNKNYVRHKDGTALTDTERAKTIAGSTLAELNEYDWGIVKGEKYAGTPILTLDDFCAFCSVYGCIADIETKVKFSEAQIVAIANIFKRYNLGSRCTISEDANYCNDTLSYWLRELPNCNISIRGGSRYYSTAKQYADMAVAAGHNTSISFTSLDNITDSVINELIMAKVSIGYSEVISTADADDIIYRGLNGVIKYYAERSFNVVDYMIKHY